MSKQLNVYYFVNVLYSKDHFYCQLELCNMFHCGNLADVLKYCYYSAGKYRRNMLFVDLLYLPAFTLKFEIFYLRFVCEMQSVVLFSRVYKPTIYFTVHPGCHFDIHKTDYSRHVKMGLPSEFYCP